MRLATLCPGTSLRFPFMGKATPTLGETVAANLTRLMQARGMNDRAIEAACGIGHKTVNNMRHGRHAPELDNIEKVAAALRVKPWMLLVPDFADSAFTDDDIRSLIENYVAASPRSREQIAGFAHDAALAANHRKAS